MQGLMTDLFQFTRQRINRLLFFLGNRAIKLVNQVPIAPMIKKSFEEFSEIDLDQTFVSFG